PISSFLGSPISGALLGITGLGLKGWQWLFIIEGIPALLLAIATPFVLPNRPRDARWLPAEERAWLERTLAIEASQSKPVAHPSLGQILSDSKVWLFAFIYFGSSASSYGLTIWTPQIIKDYGLTNWQTGLLNSLPYGVACVAMIMWGQHSDKTGERRWHLSLSFMLLALGLIGGTVLTGLVPLLLALTLAACGVFMLKGPFWAMATEQIPTATAAASIAAINSIGNLGGFAGPFAIGAIKDATGSFTLSLLPMIAFALISGGLALVAKRQNQTVAVPAE
ncbi:MAG: MFS transporter, partial [Janthinobacterium lividum]